MPDVLPPVTLAANKKLSSPVRACTVLCYTFLAVLMGNGLTAAGRLSVFTVLVQVRNFELQLYVPS